jgi:hypothetical protein
MRHLRSADVIIGTSPDGSLARATFRASSKEVENQRTREIIEFSSGGWTRTSTSQLQRLVGCQLPNAGV